MMAAAKALVYIGFDLFSAATAEDDEREFNVKPHYPWANLKLPFAHRLYQGYSSETLPAFATEYGAGRIDFAYIDGGHSVATIRSDWEWCRRLVRPGGVVVFDDYYPDAPEERLAEIGCNAVLPPEAEILPVRDPVVNGWHVQMAKVVV